VSTFYLLPPRAVLGQRLLAALGISSLPTPEVAEVVETLGKAVETTGAFVVYRDDLPPGDEPARALVDGFGAEQGDEIIEIGSDTVPRRWHVSDSLTRGASEESLARASG
jgi:hypothetical protein